MSDENTQEAPVAETTSFADRAPQPAESHSAAEEQRPEAQIER